MSLVWLQMVRDSIHSAGRFARARAGASLAAISRCWITARLADDVMVRSWWHDRKPRNRLPSAVSVCETQEELLLGR